MYYNKWWKKRASLDDHASWTEIPELETAGDDCPAKRHKSLNEMASSLGVVNIGGIFVVLLCGLALAFVVAIVEFCCKRDSKTTVVFPAPAAKIKNHSGISFSSGPNWDASATEIGQGGNSINILDLLQFLGLI